MATLKIFNDIVSEEDKADLKFWGLDGVCFKDVDDFISNIPQDDNNIELVLHCKGGSTLEGWAIVDKLRATGKTIEATIVGTCASMATIILLAASVRKGHKHAQLLIHEPYIPEYTLADAYRAEDLQKMADDLQAETSRFLDFYVERTGTDRAELEALMKEDKFITMDRAKELGFIHEIIQPSSAKAISPASWGQNNKKAKMSEDKKTLAAAALRTLGKVLGINDRVALTLNTESGETLTVEREEGDPAVGDKASPDGEHLMPNGTMIVVVDGVITEIREAEDEGETTEKELEEAKARITELESQLAEAKKQAKTSDDKRILNAVAIAGGEDWLQRAASDYRPAGRTVATKSASGGTEKRISKTAQRLKDLGAKTE